MGGQRQRVLVVLFAAIIICVSLVDLHVGQPRNFYEKWNN